MTNWATGGRVKVERAKEHIRNLEAEIASLQERSPYSIVRDDDLQSGDLVLRARIPEEPPLRWGAIAGDAVHNFRSSLDVLWHQLMFPDGGGTSNRHGQFRVYDSFEELEAACSREVGSSRKAAIDVYKTLKPYRGGNNPLCSLALLDNVNKHRILIPVVASVGHFGIDFYGVSDPAAAHHVAGEFIDSRQRARLNRPLYDGAELFRVDATRRDKVNIQIHSALKVCFGEGHGIRRGWPVVETLHEFASLIDGVVETFIRAGLVA